MRAAKSENLSTAVSYFSGAIIIPTLDSGIDVGQEIIVKHPLKKFHIKNFINLSISFIIQFSLLQMFLKNNGFRAYNYTKVIDGYRYGLK